MADPWRFRPISGHQICPVCSIPHQPFCLLPLSFSYDGLRRFPTELRSPPFHRSVYEPFPVPPERGSSTFQPKAYAQTFIHEEVMERDNLRKRMRVEDPGMGMHRPFRQFNGHFPVDVERRMNLIRDHGMQSSTLLVQDESRQIYGDNWMDRHPYDRKENQYSGVGIDNGFPETEFYHRSLHFQAKTHQGIENQQSLNLQWDERLRPQQSMEYQRPELDSDGRFVSETFLPCATGESSLKDSWKQASYSTIEKNSLWMENCDDQLEAQSIQNPSSLFQKHHPYSRTDNYHMAPYHEENAFQTHGEIKWDFDKQHGESRRAPYESSPSIQNAAHKPLDPHPYPVIEQPASHFSKQASYSPAEATFMPSQGHTSLAYPPFAPRPLFPIRAGPSLPNLRVNSPVSAPSFVPSPVAANPSVRGQLSVYGSHSLPHGDFHNEVRVQTSSGYAVEGLPSAHHPTSNLDDKCPSHPVHHSCIDEPTYVDASHLFKQPYRASRPDHIVIILRGLPGSGKSYLAKAIRDVEVENGGSVPRIHAMDDYFMIEVEKVEDNGLKSSGSARSKKQALKKVIEYCYEPELEEIYRSSMLKAFKKTLEEGTFTFVIVDDRNLRVADFAQFWAIAKRSGYEAYLLEATYKDPVGCAARNIHGFNLDDIQKMAGQWEDAPPLYLQLDIQALFGGDQLNEQSIQEVDMEAEDAGGDGELHHLQDTENYKSEELKSLDPDLDHGSFKLGKRWNTEEEVSLERNEVRKSKWSENLDADVHDSKSTNPCSLSGLIQAYGKDVKSVSWGDRVDMSGFSIGAVKKHCSSSLIIGPGAGYNLKSNPLLEVLEEAREKINNDTKRLFSEQLRAERESFRAVFDRRRQRIGGLGDADDD